MTPNDRDIRQTGRKEARIHPARSSPSLFGSSLGSAQIPSSFLSASSPPPRADKDQDREARAQKRYTSEPIYPCEQEKAQAEQDVCGAQHTKKYQTRFLSGAVGSRHFNGGSFHGRFLPN